MIVVYFDELFTNHFYKLFTLEHAENGNKGQMSGCLVWYKRSSFSNSARSPTKMSRLKENYFCLLPRFRESLR